MRSDRGRGRFDCQILLGFAEAHPTAPRVLVELSLAARRGPGCALGVFSGASGNYGQAAIAVLEHSAGEGT